MASDLEESVLALTEAISGDNVSAQTKTAIHKVVIQSGMDGPDSAPTWLILIFKRMTHGKILELTPFSTEGFSANSVFTLLSNLSDVTPLKYEEHEGHISITAEATGVEASIWVKSNYYQVKRV